MILRFKVAANEKNRELDVISSYQTSGYLCKIGNYPKCNVMILLKILSNPGCQRDKSVVIFKWFSCISLVY